MPHASFLWIYVTLIAAVAPGLLGQAPDMRYQALKDALGLSDVQIAQCQRDQQEPYKKADRILNESQKSRLNEIVNRLLRSDADGALANWLGLNKEVGWQLCKCYCTMEIYAPYLGFSDAQLAKLWELERGSRVNSSWYDEMWKRWLAVRNSGVDKDSREFIEARQLIIHLLWGFGAPNVPHDAAMSLLTDAQKATAAELESALQLVSQAIDLGLVPRHFQNSEGLCQ